MTTHMGGRDGARTPARAPEPKAGEKTPRRERVKWVKTKYGRMAVPYSVWARPPVEERAKA
jgi:hypothetical protein